MLRFLNYFSICFCLALLSTSVCGQDRQSGSLFAAASLEKISTGNKFVEGPVWKDSVGLFFSDIQGNTIYLYSDVDKTVKPFLKPSDSSNGLALDREGRLILTQMGRRRIARRETDGTLTPLISRYNGKRFNCPNDLVVKSDGSIFFTDPDFNIPSGQKAELSIKGIYRLSPSGGLTVLDSTFDKPNGICFSPDEKKLYVCESPQVKIYVWDVVNDSTLANKRLLYTIPAYGYADGMKTDSAGNIYCTGPGGVWIVSPTGSYLDKIVTPETPTNCAWGDADRKTLYITAGTSLYRIRMATSGLRRDDHGSTIHKSFRLYPNYPNPFNPSTTIPIEASQKGTMTITVFNVLGRLVASEHVVFDTPGTRLYRFTASGLASGCYGARFSMHGEESVLRLQLVH